MLEARTIGTTRAILLEEDNERARWGHLYMLAEHS